MTRGAFAILTGLFSLDRGMRNFSRVMLGVFLIAIDARAGVEALDHSKDWLLKKDLGEMRVYAHREKTDLFLSVETRPPGQSEEEKLLSQSDVQKYTAIKSKQLKEVGVGDWKPLAIEYKSDAAWREFVVSGVFGRDNADTAFVEWHMAGKKNVYQLLFSSNQSLDAAMPEVVAAIQLLKK